MCVCVVLCSREVCDLRRVPLIPIRKQLVPEVDKEYTQNMIGCWIVQGTHTEPVVQKSIVQSHMTETGGNHFPNEYGVLQVLFSSVGTFLFL